MPHASNGALELVQNPLSVAEGGSSGEYVAEEEQYVEPGVHSGKGESSVAGATANLVNCVVGAGIIGLPAAVNQCGFFMGGICLGAVAYLLCRSAIYLVECGEKLDKHNFESMAEHLFGPIGYYVTTASMATFAYGGMTAYMVILGDTLPPVFSLFVEDETYSSRAFLVLMSATFLMLPICMLKSLSDMVWASTLSVLADAALICIILAEGPQEADRQGIELKADHISFIQPGIFAGIGTMSFAFVMHHNSFIIYKSLKNPTLRNWTRVTQYSAFIALVFALTLGLGGYLIFNTEIEGDVLNNFESTGPAVTIGKVLLALCMLLTYPVECFIARHCVNSLIDYYRTRPYDNLETTTSSVKSDVSRADEAEIIRVVKSSSVSNARVTDLGDDIEVDLGGDDEQNGGAASEYNANGDDENTVGDDGTAADGSSKLTVANVSLRGDHSFFRSDTWHVLVTIMLWGSSTLLSLVFTDLEIVLSFTGWWTYNQCVTCLKFITSDHADNLYPGCIAASMLGYILPAMMYFATNREDVQVDVATWNSSSLSYEPSLRARIRNVKKYFVPFILFVFGVCVMFIGLSTILYGAEESEHTHA